MKLKDKVWIWGHPENSLKGNFGIVKDSDVSPVKGMEYLGARNIFYVPMGRLKAEEKDVKSAEMQEKCLAFGWSKEPWDTIDEIVERKKRFPSFKILIYDDFFRIENEGNNALSIGKEELIANRKKLNGIGVEVWVVLYERDKDADISEYMDCFDGVSFWFWNQPTEKQYAENVRIFIEKTPDKKRFIGCYLYDFGRERACDPHGVETELENDRKLLAKGLIDGVILHTNAVGNMGLEGYEICAKWMEKNGEKKV